MTKHEQRNQWQHVREAREKLATALSEPKIDDPNWKDKAKEWQVWFSLSRLREAWQTLDRDLYEGRGARIDLEEVSDNPLAALMVFIETGVYPPPELLAGLLASWKEYMDDGTRTLEEAFLGSPKKGSGSYSKRAKKARAKALVMNSYFAFRENLNRTEERAAEMALEVHPECNIDADSLVRDSRRHNYNFSRIFFGSWQVMALKPLKLHWAAKPGKPDKQRG